MTLRRMCRSFYLLLHCWYNTLHLELALLASTALYALVCVAVTGWA